MTWVPAVLSDFLTGVGNIIPISYMRTLRLEGTRVLEDQSWNLSYQPWSTAHILSATALAIKENKGSVKTEGVVSLFLVETGCIYGNMRF